MKHLAVVALLFTFNGFAQDAVSLDLKAICEGKQDDFKFSMKKLKLDKKPLMIVDEGFCAVYLEQQYELKIIEELEELGQKIKVEPADRWKVRLYASHSFTTYFDSDITFRSTRYNVDIKDYSWAERSSREFFEPKTWAIEGNNPFQMIDEPANTFTAEVEKNGHSFFIQAFHPKFLQAPDQSKYMKGTIDGVWVDGFAPVNKPFDGYDQVPGESELVGNANTHRQMTFEVGYGYRFNLFKSKYGSITYVPSVAVGVMVGNNHSTYLAKGEWWEFESYDDAYGIQGYGGSITNRIELNSPKERFGIFYENKLSMYHQEHGFLDGTQKYNLSYMGNSIGMKFMIYNPNNHKKKVPKN